MKTFIFIEKNGNATLTFSEVCEEYAWEKLEEIVRDPSAWRLSKIKDEESF